MAGEDDTIAVQVDDLDTVQVAVEDDNSTAKTEEQKVVEAKDKTRTRTKRVSPDASPAIPDGPSPDQALAEAQAFAKQQEDARKAAEQTAIAERQRADAAEAARQRAVKESEEHQERANNSQLTLVESRIASAQNEITALQDSFERAAEAGEFKKMGELQTKLARAAAALDRHEALKADLEANPPQNTTEGAVTASTGSPAEQHLAQYAPAAQSWLRQHMDCLPPQFGGDSTKHSNMMKGHYSALAKGYATNSEPYFKEIEANINSAAAIEPATQQTAISKAADVQPAAAPRAAPAPAAPPSRDAPLASGQAPQRSSREVRLTKDQQEMAKLSFPHLKDAEAFGLYARNLLELEAEGKIGRLTH